MLKLQFLDNPAKSLWLAGDILRIGADTDNDIVITGLSIRPNHAQLSIRNDDVTLHCVSGTCYVNSMPVDDGHFLQVGDELRIGAQTLILIDPKKIDADSAAPVLTSVAAEKKQAGRTQWGLQALHAQLQNREFNLGDGSILGREKDCSLFVPYKLLSRQHARFEVKNNELFVTDMNSGNGTFVNGQRVQRARLQPGDKIAFARLSFKVLGPEIVKTMAKETVIRPKIEWADPVDEPSGLSFAMYNDDGEEPMTAVRDEIPTSSFRVSLWAGAVMMVLLGAGFVFLYLQN